MSEPTMAWRDLVEYSETHDLLAKRLFVVFSNPTNGLGPVLENLDPHVEHQTRLELDGTMFAAGPFASDDEQQWNGEGMFIYRAESLAAARKIAESDPMHTSGARSFTIRSWMLNEGTFSVQLFYSGGKPRIV
ncbi:YciI family protein [Pseudonocardia sp. GCM10023141]|uniref:YciI family protein n=1 Tax=Pseudonocardia sp. GCM10023141 TaxID=3252653 RepID=UPI0036060EA8